MNCKQCNKPTQRGMHHGHRWGPWKKYCSKECRDINAKRVLVEVNKKYAVQFSLERSKRMKKNNPMREKNSVEKMKNTLKRIGHKPKIQGGNGREMPIPQRVLLTALGRGWYAEHIVVTKGILKSPYNYKIDIANPKKMIAIEVDGSSHNSVSRQKQDINKSKVLKFLGWKVFRFKNNEIMTNLKSVINKI